MLTFAEISLSFRNERDEKRFPGIERVWDYLARRGVTRAQADAAGLHVMQAVELIAAARRSPNVNAADNRAAIVFPHYKLGDRDNLIEWWSARLVPLADRNELRVVASFGELVDPTKARTPGKMFCPPNEPPHGYLPPTYDWARLTADQRVYIHESALKALNGAILGTASVGLNGVWGWCSRKHSIALIEELRDLPWKALRLEPVIVFDSNAWDNWQVQAAESALAAKLLEVTGRTPISLRVPKTPGGEDQGFDDYRHVVGDVAAREFLAGAGVPVDISDARRMMLQLSAEVCVVRELGRIADQATGDLMTRAVFTDVNYAHFVVDVDDGDRVRQVNIPKVWLTSADRVEAQSLEYTPGAGRLVPQPRGVLPNLNLWRGMGLDPEPGDIEPWLELLANNVPDDDLRQWIIQWCAYPLQHPGRKMNSFILMFGPSGTGKNLFFKPLHHIYGANAVVLDTDAVRSQFTSLYAQRQFVHADELVRTRAGDEDVVSQRIKALVTSEQLKVNTKGQPEYTIANHVNLAITSNYWDCIKLDQDDRRACVIRWGDNPTGVDRRGDQPYWKNYVVWAEGPGAAALYDFLLGVDLAGFDPAAWAPVTPWKEQAKEATMSELAMWVKDLYMDPEAQISGGGTLGKALFTAKELCCLFYNKTDGELTTTMIRSMGAELRNRGFRQANDGKPLRRPGGSLDRWWVVLQRDKPWDSASAMRHLKMLSRA